MKCTNRRKINKNENAMALVEEYGKDIIANDTYKSQASLKQHRASNTMRHEIGVAVGCVKMAQRLHIKVDVSSLIRGALLHDFYLYQYTKTHTKGHFHHHGQWAAINASEHFGINELERNMIECHMWPIRFWAFPKSREGYILTIQDKIVGTRELLGFNKIA